MRGLISDGMMSWFKIRSIRKPGCGRHFLHFLLAIVGFGFNFSGSELALAQPMPRPQPVEVPGLTDVEKTSLTQILALARWEELCDMTVSLKVNRASLADIAVRVQAALPRRPPIEARQESSARFTLNLQDTRVGDILQAVANLANCNFYILSDRLLLAREDQLTEAEHAALAERSKMAGYSKPSSAFRHQAMKQLAHVISDKFGAAQTQGALTQSRIWPGRQVIEVSFGQLNPDLQQAVQQWISLTDSLGGLSPQRLTPDAIVAVSSDQDSINVGVDPGVSLGALQRGRGYRYTEWRQHPPLPR